MEKQPLHYWLPTLVDNKIKGLTCTNCSAHIKRSDLVAVGIRVSDDQKNSLYVEYSCPNPNCNYRACKLIETKKVKNIEEMCYFLLEEIQKRKRTENSKRYRKPSKEKGITDKEFAEVKEFMKTHNHIDFLKYIGAPHKT